MRNQNFPLFLLGRNSPLKSKFKISPFLLSQYFVNVARFARKLFCRTLPIDGRKSQNSDWTSKWTWASSLMSCPVGFFSCNFPYPARIPFNWGCHWLMILLKWLTKPSGILCTYFGCKATWTTFFSFSIPLSGSPGK